MLKQKLFPLISMAFLITSCSNRPSNIKLTEPIGEDGYNVGISSKSFVTDKGNKITFTFSYEKINKEVINDCPYGNIFSFRVNNLSLANFVDTSSDIEVTYNNTKLTRYDGEIQGWYNDFATGRKNVKNTFIYGSILGPGGQYYALLYDCEVEKNNADNITIKLKSNDYYKNAVAVAIAVFPQPQF